MFNYLSGILINKDVSFAIVDINGVGYELVIPLSTFHILPDINEKVKLFTYLYVREDVLRLYGFISKEEEEFFKLLISISGLGPKVGLSILSAVKVSEFKRAIFDEDIKFITKIPGIGKKSAERIVLELKSKIKDLFVPENDLKISSVVNNVAADDVIRALISLGYKQSQAKEALEKVIDSKNISGIKVEELIKMCFTYV
jgi:holliday junction DNA helicase RuvA